MAQQTAAFHPPSYTIWYEHLAGLNPQLSQALAEKLAAGESLTDAEVARLHAQHVLARDTILFELLQEVSDATVAAGQDASRFGSALEEHTVELERPMAHDLLRHVVTELLADTRHICLVTSELSKQLERSAGEIRTLSERLQRAQSEAVRDPLTGLYNRRGFERAVTEVGRGAQGLAGAALLVIDIDHFKRINDAYGHLLGDKVLRAAAELLHAQSTPEGIAARLGGEEFVLLLPETGLDAAAAVAEELREGVAKLRLKRVGRDEYVGHVTVSIGVAHAQADQTLEKLVERADAALYGAKRAGRNRVHVAGAPGESPDSGQTAPSA
jgi:diguanylate cyclase